MPRNASGNYTLPAGNPVTTGTTIEASWANSTLSDVATALTNSLSRNGEGGMLAPFRLSDGSVSAPGIAFTNEPSSGFYRPGSSQVGCAVSGVQVWSATNVSFQIPASIQFRTDNCIVKGLPAPTASADAATKAYVDAQIVAATLTSTRQTYTATAGQTTFAIAYTVGQVDVWRNGVKQRNGTDFTATNGTSVVFTSGVALNDVIDLVGYGAYAVRPGVEVVAVNTAAAVNTRYVLTASLTLTLPASPAVGDEVQISNLSGTTTCVVARNGNKIQNLAEDLTIDSLNATITLVYTGATLGWVFG
jgi:hypothetical protein